MKEGEGGEGRRRRVGGKGVKEEIEGITKKIG